MAGSLAICIYPGSWIGLYILTSRGVGPRQNLIDRQGTIRSGRLVCGSTMGFVNKDITAVN